MVVEEGTRKWWMGLIVAAILLLGLVMMLLFKKMSDAVWIAWCSAVAGNGLGYAAANVVTKTITGQVARRVKR